MPGRLRVNLTGHIQHVVQRGHNREALLLCERGPPVLPGARNSLCLTRQQGKQRIAAVPQRVDVDQSTPGSDHEQTLHRLLAMLTSLLSVTASAAPGEYWEVTTKMEMPGN